MKGGSNRPTLLSGPFPRREPKSAFARRASSATKSRALRATHGRSDFNGLHSRKHDGEVQFYAFGVLVSDGVDIRRLPLSMRKKTCPGSWRSKFPVCVPLDRPYNRLHSKREKTSQPCKGSNIKVSCCCLSPSRWRFAWVL